MDLGIFMSVFGWILDFGVRIWLDFEAYRLIARRGGRLSTAKRFTVEATP